MNQHILRGSQHRTRHPKRKSDIQTHIQLAIKRKQHAARRNISGLACKLGFSCRQRRRECQGEAHGAPDFLAALAPRGYRGVYS